MVSPRFPLIALGLTTICLILVLAAILQPDHASLTSTLVALLLIYLGLLGMSAGFGYSCQPRWHKTIQLDVTCQRTDYWWAVHSYAKLQAHNHALAQRAEPLGTLDEQLNECLVVSLDEITGLQQALNLAPNLLLLRRGWWIFTLCNLLMWVRYLHWLCQLRESKQIRSSLEERLSKGLEIRAQICTANEKVWAKISDNLHTVNDLKARSDRAVRKHSPDACVEIDYSFAVLFGLINRAHRSCQLYKLCPDEPSAWRRLVRANRLPPKLSKRSTKLKRQIQAVEDSHATFQETLQMSYLVAEQLQSSIRAESRLNPCVATHRYVHVLKKARARITDWGKLKGPRERYSISKSFVDFLNFQENTWTDLKT